MAKGNTLSKQSMKQPKIKLKKSVGESKGEAMREVAKAQKQTHPRNSGRAMGY